MAKFLSFTTRLSVFFYFFNLSLASHQGWENRSWPDSRSPSFQPAVNASQQESNNVVFPILGRRVADINKHLFKMQIAFSISCQPCLQHEFSGGTGMLWSVGSRILARRFVAVPRRLWVAQEGCIPLGWSDVANVGGMGLCKSRGGVPSGLTPPCISPSFWPRAPALP